MADSQDADRDARIQALARPDPKLLVHYAILSLAALFAAPIVFVPLFFRYHTLRYKLDADGISASWGILFRREVHLTYKRIQDIHVKRNLIERWLGIGRVEVQTASGSSSAELVFEGLLDTDAMRDYLYRRMRGHEAVAAEPAARADAGAATQDAVLVLLRSIHKELEGARQALELRRGPGA